MLLSFIFMSVHSCCSEPNKHRKFLCNFSFCCRDKRNLNHLHDFSTHEEANEEKEKKNPFCHFIFNALCSVETYVRRTFFFLSV